MLQTEKPSNAAKALAAFKIQQRTRKRSLKAHFEHGQLWITDSTNGAIWSVVDCAGGPAVNGFDFEVIEHGEEE